MAKEEADVAQAAANAAIGELATFRRKAEEAMAAARDEVATAKGLLLNAREEAATACAAAREYATAHMQSRLPPSH